MERKVKRSYQYTNLKNCFLSGGQCRAYTRCRLVILCIFLSWFLPGFGQFNDFKLLNTLSSPFKEYTFGSYNSVYAIMLNCQTSATACATNGINFTKSGTDWNATASTDCGTGGLVLSYSASGGVSPATGSSLNGVVFRLELIP